jgi:hypothetical protein
MPPKIVYTQLKHRVNYRAGRVRIITFFKTMETHQPDSPTVDQPPIKRKRLSLACNACRRKKVVCNLYFHYKAV